jgi:hypothetical protein
MKIIIVFILIVLILSLIFKLYSNKQKRHNSPIIAKEKIILEQNKPIENFQDTIVKDNSILKVEDPYITPDNLLKNVYIQNTNYISDDNITDTEPDYDEEVEINTIRNRRKIINKSLKRLRKKKNIDYSLANVPYYKPDFDPNTRLEKTNRPNGYEFVNKDNIKPKLRLKSEKKFGFKHIKPGKNLFSSYGYSYMPPEVWSVPQDRPPVCIPQKGFKAEALPIYTKGTPLDALEIQQTLMPKFKYEEVYDPKYYYPGWKTK